MPGLLSRDDVARFAHALEHRGPAGRSGPAPRLDEQFLRDLALAERLSALGEQLCPRPEPVFTTRLRLRLVAVAGLPRPRPSRGQYRVALSRGARLAGAGLAATIGLAGVGVASARSLPGEPFYPVKTFAESTDLRMTPDPAARGRLYLDLARRRLVEVQRLLAEPRRDPSETEEVGVALARMDAFTGAGTRLLTQAYWDEGAVAYLVELDRFARAQRLDIVLLQPRVPDVLHEQGVASLTLVDRVWARAGGLMASGDCGPAGCGPRGDVVPAVDDLGVVPAAAVTAPPPPAPPLEVTAPSAPRTAPLPPAPAPTALGVPPRAVAPVPSVLSTPSASGTSNRTPSPSRVGTTSPRGRGAGIPLPVGADQHGDSILVPSGIGVR